MGKERRMRRIKTTRIYYGTIFTCTISSPSKFFMECSMGVWETIPKLDSPFTLLIL
jgi:hypothetical protein